MGSAGAVLSSLVGMPLFVFEAYREAV
jgi:hypothetical protein